MSSVVVVMLVLAGGTYLLKAAGPVLLGGNRSLPGWLDRVAWLLPAPLLGALLATNTIVENDTLVLDARVVGVLGAAVALKLRAPFVVAVVVAAAVTAVARAV